MITRLAFGAKCGTPAKPPLVLVLGCAEIRFGATRDPSAAPPRHLAPLVHIMWAYYVLPMVIDLRLSAVTVVIVALGANASAQMAEIFRAGLQSIPRGQTEAAKVLGLSPWARLRYVILPQAVRLIMAPSVNAFVSLLKESSLAALIAVPELMNRGLTLSTDNFRPIEVLTTVAILYFVLTYPFALAGVALERRSKAGFRTL